MRGDALTAADAHRLEPVAPVAAHQFARQVGEDAPAGRADRMAERNARSVDVENLVPAVALRPAPALEHRKHLRREGFVQLDKVDVAPAKPVPSEQPLDRREPGRCPCGSGRSPRPPHCDTRRSALARARRACPRPRQDMPPRHQFCWLALPAVTTPPSSGRRLAKRLERRVGAIAPSSCAKTTRIALLLRHR